MLAFVRDFVERVKRREAAAITVVAVCGLLGMGMAITGGIAYLEVRCAPLFRPSVEETDRVAQVVIVQRRRVVALAEPPPPPPAAPAHPSLPLGPTRSWPSAPVTRVMVRGPPRA